MIELHLIHLVSAIVVFLIMRLFQKETGAIQVASALFHLKKMPPAITIIKLVFYYLIVPSFIVNLCIFIWRADMLVLSVQGGYVLYYVGALVAQMFIYQLKYQK